MLVYTHRLTERNNFIFQLIFGGLLGLDVVVTTDLARYGASPEEKLAYTDKEPTNGFFVESVPLLFQTGISEDQPDVFFFAGLPFFFKTRSGHLSFDLFAASFYLVSRYEEYLSFVPDQYGRFPAKASLAYKHGFLQTPVINCWVQELKSALHHFYPSLRFAQHRFQSTISFDIDVAYAYKGRPFWLHAGALLKDLLLIRITNLLKRREVLAGKKKDPYDTYQDIREMLLRYRATALFFFLLAVRRTRFDRNLSPRSQQLQQLIIQCCVDGDLGIHPSYYSMEKPGLLQQEKRALENLSGQTILRSRQHYLRFRLPDTFTRLAAAGITDDYSMGYAELPGFRAGICTPFYFFDLTANKATTLKLHPVAYMDGTFIEDLQLHPQDSISVIKQLIEAVKQVQGNFLCIWHNHTISDTETYKGWKQVLEETLQLVYES